MATTMPFDRSVEPGSKPARLPREARPRGGIPRRREGAPPRPGRLPRYFGGFGAGARPDRAGSPGGPSFSSTQASTQAQDAVVQTSPKETSEFEPMARLSCQGLGWKEPSGERARTRLGSAASQ